MKVLIVGKKQQMHWPENVNKYLSQFHTTRLFLYNTWHKLPSSIIGHKANAQRLKKQIEHFQPDLIFFISFDFVPMEYYKILDNFPNLKRAGWAADGFKENPKMDYLNFCFVFDSAFLPHFKNSRCKGIYMPLCADENMFQYHPYSAKKKPVFIGAANPERIDTLKALKTPILIYGSGWPKDQLKQHKVHNTKVSHRKISKLYEKYLPFNMTYSKNVKNGLNFRLFEIGTTGNVIITNDSKDLPNCYTKSQCLIYHTPEQLDTLLQNVLKDPSLYKKIAQRGYKNTIKNHTFSARLQQIFDILEQGLK